MCQPFACLNALGVRLRVMAGPKGFPFFFRSLPPMNQCWECERDLGPLTLPYRRGIRFGIRGADYPNGLILARSVASVGEASTSTLIKPP